MRKPQLVLAIALAGGLAACGETSSLQVSDGTGPSPRLPEPNKTLIPTVNIAPAIGWPEGAKPVAAAGTQVAAFAENLDHPRWLYVLPNGDVLVAETNAPPKPDDGTGIRGWVMKKVMGRAGAGVPSANRITLLRDQDHDGIAETRTVFLENLNSPSAWRWSAMTCTSPTPIDCCVFTMKTAIQRSSRNRSKYSTCPAAR
jgi:glucose/arabinose dehydrogenase